MIRSLIYCIFCAVVVAAISPGPKYPPTKGFIWPKPRYEVKQDKYLKFSPMKFKILVTDNTCDILTRAINRLASHAMQQFGPRQARRARRESPTTYNETVDENYMGYVTELRIHLNSPCEDYPYLRMDETYNLTVASVSKIYSDSIWGALYGLESFSQLFYLSDDLREMRVNLTEISDGPRFPHRGLLLDTSRHYVSVSKIITTLNAMAMNKMNVFHWHIVDDQSFPYKSEKLPELSDKGAYHPSMVYTKRDIEYIINEARDRGIRVIPEFDVPGHTRSWGAAYPNLLTPCYDGDKQTELGPLHPLRNTTYKFLKQLFSEVQDLFPDKHFHIGGDEVELNCWASNPELQDYMKEHNMQSAAELHALFMTRAIPLLKENTIPIVWQEVFDENVPLTKDTVVHIWKNDEPVNNWEVINTLSKGYPVLYSASWYLDHLELTWQKLYAVNFNRMVNNDTLIENIIGGEACMWGEKVDDRNVISRVWPRASATAEVLWSPETTRHRWYSDYNDEARRIEEHTCRMIRRKIDAEPPSGPGFCLA